MNTVQIIPRSPAAGYVEGQVIDDDILHLSGIATGNLRVEIIDPMKIEDQDTFKVTFQESPTRFSIEDLKLIDDQFIANVDKFISLSHKNINDSTFYLTDTAEVNIYNRDVDYELDAEFGRIKALATGDLEDGILYFAKYTYFTDF